MEGTYDVAPVIGAGVGLLALAIWLLFAVAIVTLTVVVWWQIFKKAGFNPAMALLMLVPIANIVMLFILAFGKWPIYERLSQSVIKKDA